MHIYIYIYTHALQSSRHSLMRYWAKEIETYTRPCTLIGNYSYLYIYILTYEQHTGTIILWLLCITLHTFNYTVVPHVHRRREGMRDKGKKRKKNCQLEVNPTKLACYKFWVEYALIVLFFLKWRIQTMANRLLKRHDGIACVLDDVSTTCLSTWPSPCPTLLPFLLV